MPPTPSAVHEIKYAADTGVTIDTHLRREGARDLHPPTTKTVAETSEGSVDALVKELEGILQNIPQTDESSADIYGLDVGVFFGSDNIQWRNGASEGCGGATAENEPTAEQKTKFRRAVEISDELVALGVAEGN